VIPGRPTLLRRALIALVAMTAGLVVTGCGALLETPPAATPTDFGGIAGDMVQRGIRLDHIASGDAGCNDPTLAQTAIRFDADGLDQTSPTRVYVYIFGDHDSFERLRQSIDACARSYVTDPDAFESIDQSPFVVAGPGPWGPDFKAAVKAALVEAAGTGG
jgi:hypothetical protein